MQRGSEGKEIGVSTEELKRLFRDFAVERPIDEDVWRGDVELGWPRPNILPWLFVRSNASRRRQSLALTKFPQSSKMAALAAS